MPSWCSPRRSGRISAAATSIRPSPIIAAASVATVPLLARADRHSLRLRVLSALVLAPIAIAGAAIVFWIALRGHDREPHWVALGALWVALPCVLLLWLARPDEIGSRTVLWIFAIVWATDIGAYAIGRRFGGPRLAPRWSPRK